MQHNVFDNLTKNLERGAISTDKFNSVYKLIFQNSPNAELFETEYKRIISNQETPLIIVDDWVYYSAFGGRYLICTLAQNTWEPPTKNGLLCTRIFNITCDHHTEVVYFSNRWKFYVLESDLGATKAIADRI